MKAKASIVKMTMRPVTRQAKPDGRFTLDYTGIPRIWQENWIENLGEIFLL